MNTVIAGGVGGVHFSGRNSLYIFSDFAPFFSKHLIVSVSSASARGVRPFKSVQFASQLERRGLIRKQKFNHISVTPPVAKERVIIYQ